MELEVSAWAGHKMKAGVMKGLGCKGETFCQPPCNVLTILTCFKDTKKA